MANRYIVSQGSVYMGPSNGLGGYTSLRPVGNVNEFTLNPTEEFYDHIENETGKQFTDLSISNRTMCTISISFESLVKENLRDLLKATITTVAGATVTNEEHTAGGPGTALVLKQANITTFTSLTDDAATPVPYTAGTDYIVRPPSNVINIPIGSTIGVGDVVEANYVAGSSTVVNAFKGTVNEYYMLFDGIDKVSKERFTLELFRARIEPATGLQLIGDEIIRAPINAMVLYDPTQDTTAKPFGGFFRWSQAVPV